MYGMRVSGRRAVLLASVLRRVRLLTVDLPPRMLQAVPLVHCLYDFGHALCGDAWQGTLLRKQWHCQGNATVQYTVHLMINNIAYKTEYTTKKVNNLREV